MKNTKTKRRRKVKTTIKDENNSNDNRDGDGSWCDSPAPKLVVTLGWQIHDWYNDHSAFTLTQKMMFESMGK